MAKPKADQSPSVTSRRSSMNPHLSKIVEISGPKGNGLLLEVCAPRDGRNVYLRPYRADQGNVFIEVRQHAADCALGGHSTSERTRDVNSEICDCGACLVYNPETYSWNPTVRNVFFGTQKRSPV